MVENDDDWAPASAIVNGTPLRKLLDAVDAAIAEDRRILIVAGATACAAIVVYRLVVSIGPLR